MKIIEADHHRNGVGGEGFYVAIVKDDDNTCKLLVCFPQYTDIDTEALEQHQERLAVLDLHLAATGNIYMHPAPVGGHEGGNAWRGADQYSHLLPTIAETIRARYDAINESARKDKA